MKQIRGIAGIARVVCLVLGIHAFAFSVHAHAHSLPDDLHIAAQSTDASPCALCSLGHGAAPLLLNSNTRFALPDILSSIGQFTPVTIAFDTFRHDLTPRAPPTFS